ncbi:hypothetical protein HAX54_048615 [Datura stramonium]|uniref:Uncharacterized protein n=1 Tax=Datura stramonium TaxID=4076 RepID=A0ABS8STX4_DATST|nr:hypothetical protein [Datura stramonium]
MTGELTKYHMIDESSLSLSPEQCTKPSPISMNILPEAQRDSLCWQVKGAEKDFQEGLITTARGHLKRSIVEEVRIIESELPKYLDIEAKYKLYGLGWMSEAICHYYPTMVCEFYANYIAILEGLRKKGQKPSKVLMQKSIPVEIDMVDISTETINRMLYWPDFIPPVSIAEFKYWMREQHNQRNWLA